MASTTFGSRAEAKVLPFLSGAPSKLLPSAPPYVPSTAGATAADALAHPLIQAAKILIIDDELSNVRLLERILKRANCQNVVSTTDPREALAYFQKHEPDLVLTDWMMPHMNGLAVLRQLRESLGSNDYLPIVVLTADVTAETKRKALAAGATDFLTKPFDHTEVLLRIGNCSNPVRRTSKSRNKTRPLNQMCASGRSSWRRRSPN